MTHIFYCLLLCICSTVILDILVTIKLNKLYKCCLYHFCSNHFRRSTFSFAVFNWVMEKNQNVRNMFSVLDTRWWHVGFPSKVYPNSIGWLLWSNYTLKLICILTTYILISWHVLLSQKYFWTACFHLLINLLRPLAWTRHL